ncbi:MAG: SOS response-associated peptidase [Actinomycetota bacterium]
MCSRFELNAPARVVMARFCLKVPPPLPNRAEVRPTDAALVVGSDGPRLGRWGLEVDWDKRPLINARAETLAAKPTFRRLLGSRVLVPATLWWEWRKEGKARHKMRLKPEAADLFAFAGLADGERFTLVTCEACTAAAHVHDRMPVVLDPAAEAAWLDQDQPFEAVAGALRPWPGGVDVADDPDGGPGLFD